MMISSSRQSDFAAKFFDAVNQAGQHAFGFRQRQAAGGQGGAGHRRRVQHAGLIFGLHAVRRENRIDAGLVGFAHVGENDVLIRRSGGIRVCGNFSAIWRSAVFNWRPSRP